MRDIISKQEAKINNQTRFFTGMLCKAGHLTERLTSSGECIGCKQDREARKYVADPTVHQQQYINNRIKRLERQKIADSARRDEKLEYGRQWRADNTDYAKQYRATRADLYRYHAALRRSTKRKATPCWAELDQIKEVYLQAEIMSKSGEVQYEVDHIVPLKHQLVCGLHCMSNLRIISKDENRTKKNTFVVG
jgi:hypothetical protein